MARSEFALLFEPQRSADLVYSYFLAAMASPHNERLPEAEELVLQDADLRQMLVEIARRQAGSASKGGR